VPDIYAIEWAQYSFACPKCKATAVTTVGNSGPVPCRGCGEAIDLKSPEVKLAREEAAKRAMDRALKDAGG
jgi:ribosomal protein L37AE/L43A